MISSIESTAIFRLRPWEEGSGKLESIEEENGTCIAFVGKAKIAIPFDFKQRLLPHLGSRISILRTEDIPGCEYLYRVLDSDTNQDKKFSKERLEHW
jgi:hypothetical protein